MKLSGYLLPLLFLLVITVILLKPYTLPRIIWSYWHSQDIPELQKTILAKRKAILPTFEHIVVSDNTIAKYISTPFPKNYDQLIKQHKADWVRLELIKAHGGCWMDVGIIINSAAAFEKIYNDTLQTRSSFTGFYLDRYTINNDPSTFVENWFIMAPKNSSIIDAWLKEFTKAIVMGLKEYRKSVELAYSFEYFYNIHGVYLTQHVAFQVIMRNMLLRPFIILYRAEDTMFRLKDKCNWISPCVMETIRDDPTVKTTIPFIKLTSGETHLDIDISGYFK
jgi:Capsular polysaccharide synthesis protein